MFALKEVQLGILYGGGTLYASSNLFQTLCHLQVFDRLEDLGIKCLIYAIECLIIQLELLFLTWGWSFQVKHYKVLLNNSLILPLHSL